MNPPNPPPNPRNPGDLQYWSHRDKNPFLVPPIETQLWPACWSVAPTRHMEALLKIREAIGDHSSLSIQEMIDTMPRKRLDKDDEFSLKKVSSVKWFFEKIGTLLHDGSPCLFNFEPKEKKISPDSAAARFKAKTVVVHSYNDCEDDDLYDAKLERFLHVSPIAIRVAAMLPEFDDIQGYDIYRPPEERTEEDFGHYVLLTGYGIDSEGRKFWECQDSAGGTRGVDGYIRIARGDNLITDFFEMRF